MKLDLKKAVKYVLENPAEVPLSLGPDLGCLYMLDSLKKIDRNSTIEKFKKYLKEVQPKGQYSSKEEKDRAYVNLARGAIRGLYILDALDEIDCSKVIEIIKKSQNPDGGFIFESCDETHFYITTLARLRAVREINTESAIDFILSRWVENNTFGAKYRNTGIIRRVEYNGKEYRQPESWIEPDNSFTYDSLVCLYYLKGLKKLDTKPQVIKSVLDTRNSRGIFWDQSGGNGGEIGTTFHAVASLHILSAIDELDGQIVPSYTPVRVDYSAHGSKLYEVKYEEFYKKDIIDYIVSCQAEDGGFFGRPSSDPLLFRVGWEMPEYKSYVLPALATLSILGHKNMNLWRPDVGSPLEYY